MNVSSPSSQPIDTLIYLVMRAQEIGSVIAGKADPDATFAPLFMSQVPAAKLKEISQSLTDQYGPVVEVMDLQQTGTYNAQFKIRFERGIASATLSLDQDQPHKVIGFFISDVAALDNSPEAIVAAFAKLTGKVGFTITRLGPGAPQEVLAYHSDQQYAIGSAFKLWVLDTLAEDVAAGKRKWSDVVPLSVHSLPSGAMQDWPQGTPVTLATLATQMISISDNTATDMLMKVLGRDAIAARVRATGHSDPSRMLPMLTTLEAFSLKVASDADVDAYASADDIGQAAILDRFAPSLSADKIEAWRLTAPQAAFRINRVEWFASARDLAGVMQSLRLRKDPMVMQILSVNPGLGPALASQYARFGFKGGSENGVLNLTFVVQNKAGDWYAVAASWNDPAPLGINQTHFVALTRQLLERAK